MTYDAILFLCLLIVRQEYILVRKGYGCKYTTETIQHYTKAQLNGYGCKYTRETIQHYTKAQINGYGCKYTRETIQNYTKAQIKGYGCKHTRETIQHYTKAQIKGKEQLVVRKGMDVITQEKLSNITLRHKLKERNHAFIAVQLFHGHCRNEQNSYSKISSVFYLLVVNGLNSQ